MKTIIKSSLLLIVSILISQQIQAQKPIDNPKYGVDGITREACAGHLSTMSEFVKIKTFDYAYPSWIFTFQNCPAASKNIYIHGKKIIDFKINTAPTEVLKQAYIDTLMLLYDQRIQYFGEESKVLGKKGLDLLKYRRKEIEQANELLTKSFKVGGNKTNAAVLATLVTTSGILYKSGKIEADEMINTYLSSMDALEGQTPNSKLTKAINSVEKTFAETGAADCDALIEIFTPKYEANKQDVELLKKLTRLLKQTKCQESDLYVNASASLYEAEPSAEAGANLAVIFASRNEYDKSFEYYQKAVNIETDSELKAGYYYQIAAISMKQKNYPAVRNYARLAIDLKSNYGAAYILIGNAYAASSSISGSTNFEKAAVYLVAVDKMVKAKAVDESISEEATKYINQYSGYFPNNEDAFFEGYTSGDSYTVKSWINESTTICTVKN